jgi:hypothetical protein
VVFIEKTIAERVADNRLRQHALRFVDHRQRTVAVVN